MNTRVHRNETIILEIIVWGGCYIRRTLGGVGDLVTVSILFYSILVFFLPSSYYLLFNVCQLLISIHCLLLSGIIITSITQIILFYHHYQYQVVF